jgi:hypothetical protein
MPYPVTVQIDPQLDGKNRLTTAFRLILVIPHAVLVGPSVRIANEDSIPGLLASAAYFLAIVSWFTLVFAGRQFNGIREFSLYYLRWRTRVMAYVALFTDRYPPFGDDAYPATIDVAAPVDRRDVVSIALRLILALPHLIVLVVLLFAWTAVTIVAWFVVLFTGSYPESLYPFASGVLRWALRVEVYLLLLVDEYPPFSLE